MLKISTINIFKEAFKTVDYIDSFVKKYGLNVKEAVKNGINIDTENFIETNNTIYYLSKANMCILYDILQKKNYLNIEINQDYFLKEAHNLKISKMFEKLIKAMENFSNEEILDAKFTEAYKWHKIFQKSYQQNPNSFILCIVYSLEDKVLNALLKNKLVMGNIFQISQTEMFYSLGKNLVNSIIFSNASIERFLPYNKSKNNMSAEEVYFFQKCWINIYTHFNNNNSIPVNKILKIIIKDNNFKKLLSFIIKDSETLDNTILKIVILYIFNYGFKQIIEDDKKYSELIEYCVINKVDVSRVKEKYDIITIKINEYMTISGVSIVNFLVKKKIFIKLKEYKQKKTPAMIRLTNDIMFELTVNSSKFMPYLINENSQQVNKGYTNEEKRIEFINNTNKNIIHEKGFNKVILKEDSIIMTHPEILRTKFCIDVPFLKDYLLMLDDIINKNFEYLSVENQQKAFYFLSLYEINLETFYKSVDKNLQTLILKLINYGLNLEIQNDNLEEKELKNAIKNLKNKNIKIQFNNMYNKIKSFKIPFITTISRCIIYSKFNYFILEQYLDFRLRAYYIEVFLNPLGYKFIKCFVKPYDNISKLEDKNILYDKVLKIINNNTVKKQLMDNSKIITDSYLQNEIEKYFLNHLKEGSHQEFLKYYSGKDKLNIYFWASFIYENIKKKEEFLKILSYLLLEKRDTKNFNYSNLYSYDAVQSGYQMMSILFKNKKLAKFCNLIENEEVDLYQNITNNYRKNIEGAFKVAELILKRFFGKEWLDIYIIMKNNYQNPASSISNIDEVSIENIFFYLLTQPKLNSNEFVNMINSFNKVANYPDYQLLFKNLHKNFTDYDWMLDLRAYGSYLSKNKNLKCFFNFYEIVKLKYALQNNVWIEHNDLLNQRALFKKSIMIELYGGTIEARKKYLTEFFEKKSMELAIIFINYKSLNILIYNIDRFFRKYRDTILKETQYLKHMVKFIQSKEDGIIIDTENAIITLKEIKQKEKAQRVTIREFGNKKVFKVNLKSFSIRYNGNFILSNLIQDQKAMQRSTPVNVIHSMDANSVHNFKGKTNNLRVQLNEYNVDFSIVINHDCYSLGKHLLVFVPYILSDCYIDLYKFDYLKCLEKNFNKVDYDYFYNLYVENPNSLNYLPPDFYNLNFVKLN